MEKLNNLWVRGIAGLGVTVAAIVVTMSIYPVTGSNVGGHAMAWILSVIVGLKIALSAYETSNDSWAGAVMETGVAEETESMTKPAAAVEQPHRAVALTAKDRMSWKPATVPALEYPVEFNRNKPVVVESSFHQPDGQEKAECIRFAAENPICSLATLDEKNNQRPHVRTVFLWRADDSGFFFVLFSSKEVSRQVKANPLVELCFQNHPADLTESKQLRVSGQMELMDNRKLKEAAARDRTILNTQAGDGQEAHIEVYQVSSFEMKFWQMGAFVAQKVKYATVS